MASLNKRFYEKTNVEERGLSFAVTLDGRIVKTPARRELILPSQQLAQIIAQEFDQQAETINPALMPATRLANTVIDGIVDNPQPIAEDIMRFIAADQLFYRVSEPEELKQRQMSAFDPLLDFIEAKFSIQFEIGEKLAFITQKRESLSPLRHYINAITSPFVLGGLHAITSLTASGLIAIALKEAAIEGDKAWEIAHLEEDWTAEHWGQDAEALARRTYQALEFNAALAFLHHSAPHQNNYPETMQ